MRIGAIDLLLHLTSPVVVVDADVQFEVVIGEPGSG